MDENKNFMDMDVNNLLFKLYERDPKSEIKLKLQKQMKIVFEEKHKKYVADSDKNIFPNNNNENNTKSA